MDIVLFSTKVRPHIGHQTNREQQIYHLQFVWRVQPETHTETTKDIETERESGIEKE